MSAGREQFGASTNREGLLLAMIALLGLGLIMVFSATGASRSMQLQTGFLFRHLLFLVCASLIFCTLLHFPRTRLLRAAPWLFAGFILLLCLVLIPGVGSKINGARRWLRFGPFSLQPSEFMKVILPLFLAWWSRRQITQKTYASQFLGMFALILTPLLIAMQPDLGTALLVFGMGACFLFLAGWPVRMFLLGGLSVLPALGLLMIYRPYQLTRIQNYLDSLGSWENAQYQIKQSLLTMSSGGLWGTGPGRGLQKLSFLPESHTDFVFAVIGEELGLVGMFSVILLWGIVLWCGTRLVLRLQHDRECFALAGTLLAGIIFQAVVNTAVVTSLLPPKGISHPLLSYGGSNLLTVLIAFAIILNLTNERTVGTTYQAG